MVKIYPYNKSIFNPNGSELLESIKLPGGRGANGRGVWFRYLGMAAKGSGLDIAGPKDGPP